MNENAKLIKVGSLDKPGKRHDGNLVYDPRGISPTLLSRDYKGPVKVLVEDKRDKSKGGVPIKNGTKIGYLMAYDGDGVDLAYPSSTARRGRVQPQSCQTIQTTQTLGVMLFED